MPMTINRSGSAERFAQALISNDAEGITQSWNDCMQEIARSVAEDYERMHGDADAAILAQRGYRQLTQEETSWYQKFIDGAKGTKQAFIDIFTNEGDDAFMPETIIEDVFKHLEQDHPILSRIKFQYVGYSTKWIIDDSATQKGAWGRIDAKITEEIEGGLKILDLTQKKYTAFVVIPLAIIDLGPVWLDSYIRRVLYEAIAMGTEDAIVNGTGLNMPCGFMYKPNSSFSSSTGFTAQDAQQVTSFEPASYGALVAKLAKTQTGKQRKFSKVQLLCSMTDYLTKIMPATTTVTADGTGYARDLFPFPTEPLICNAVPSGKAVLCLLDEYTLAAGSRRNGVTEYDDSLGFLDHTRAYRNVNYFDGRPYDDTCAVVLDISELDPAYITVKVSGQVQTSAEVTELPTA